MVEHTKYPPRINVLIDLSLGQGALVIERQGLIHVRYHGFLIVLAYRQTDIWIVEYPMSSIKVAVPA